MLALLLAIAAQAASPEQQRIDDLAALTTAKLETWPGLYRANDAGGLDAFLADGFVALQPDGSTETKAQAVAWLRTNKWANAQQNFRYQIKAITFHGPDTANVYGTGLFDGADCRMAYTSANIFTRVKGRWRPAFSHTSKPACKKD